MVGGQDAHGRTPDDAQRSVDAEGEYDLKRHRRNLHSELFGSWSPNLGLGRRIAAWLGFKTSRPRIHGSDPYHPDLQSYTLHCNKLVVQASATQYFITLCL